MQPVITSCKSLTSVQGMCTYRKTKGPDVRCFGHANASLCLGAAPEDIANPGKDALVVLYFCTILCVDDGDTVYRPGAVRPRCVRDQDITGFDIYNPSSLED